MKQARLTRQALSLIIALGLQFLLGMWSNLYAPFPDTTSEEQLWKFAGSQLPVMLHVLLGTLLVFGSLALVVQAMRSGYRLWKIGSAIGFGSILLAWAAGREFVATQKDAFSFGMAIFFIIALITYAITLYLTASKPASSSSK